MLQSIFCGNIWGKIMKLIITIDVEEDNWGSYDRHNCSINNIGNIPKLQCLFDKYDIIPTYLINYPVANNNKAIKIFKEIIKYDKCEIGTHCHPWNTPPFYGPNGEKNSMLCNLPKDVQYNKLECLHNLITDKFCMSPISFRSGRWGFDYTVAENIYKLGYRYDTSITPFINWEREGGPDFSKIDSNSYYIYNDIENDDNNKYLLEIPATIGYCGLLRGNQDLCNRMHNLLKYDNIKQFKINTIMRLLYIYEKIWLSPENSTLEEMIRLTEFIRRKNKFLNMFFHSGSLMAGNTPFVRDIKSQEKFIKKIELYLQYIKGINIESIRLSDVKKYI
jgi:hypothetical protein